MHRRRILMASSLLPAALSVTGETPGETPVEQVVPELHPGEPVDEVSGHLRPERDLNQHFHGGARPAALPLLPWALAP